CTGGNTLAANLEKIRREEQAALREVPNVGKLFGIDLDETLGFNRQRRAIQRAAEEERGGARQEATIFKEQLRDRVTLTGLIAEGRPGAAEAAQIALRAQREAERFKQEPDARSDILAAAINEELALKRNIGPL